MDAVCITTVFLHQLQPSSFRTTIQSPPSPSHIVLRLPLRNILGPLEPRRIQFMFLIPMIIIMKMSITIIRQMSRQLYDQKKGSMSFCLRGKFGNPLTGNGEAICRCVSIIFFLTSSIDQKYKWVFFILSKYSLFKG